MKVLDQDRDFAEMLGTCDEIMARKGADYTQGAAGDEGRLRNFLRTADRLGITTRQALAGHLVKQLDAIETFCKKGQVESEPIESRIADAINYLLLLHKLNRFEERRAPAPTAAYKVSGAYANLLPRETVDMCLCKSCGSMFQPAATCPVCESESGVPHGGG